MSASSGRASTAAETHSNQRALLASLEDIASYGSSYESKQLGRIGKVAAQLGVEGGTVVELAQTAQGRQALANLDRVKQRAPELDKLVSSSEGRRALAKASASFYSTMYLGLDYAAHQDNWYSLFKEHKRLLLLSPRDHGKTEAAIRSYAGSRIAADRNFRVLVVSKTIKEARKRVVQVRQDLSSNPMLNEDFGSFSPRFMDPGGKKDKEKWGQTEFYVSGRTSNLRDATMEGVGRFGSITGGHFDLIILDDPFEFDDAQSTAFRDKLWKWFTSTILELAEPTTQIIVVGTRKHADDLYGRLIEDDQTFMVHVDKAINKWPTDVRYLTERHGTRDVIKGVWTSGDFDLLWPEKWNIEALMLKYRSDSVSFLRENQNELTDYSKSMFRRVYFTGGTIEDRPNLVFPGCLHKTDADSRPYRLYDRGQKFPGLGEPWHILQAWDLSLISDRKKAEKRDSDFTVGVTFGWNEETDERLLLNLWRDRGMLPSEVQKAITSEARRFKAVFTAIENNAFGHLHEIGLRNSTDLRLVPHTTTKKKSDAFEGVPRLISVLENGKWIIPYGDARAKRIARLIMNEFTGLGVEAHDDIVMAMWIAECIIDRYRRHLENQKRTMGRVETNRANVERR